MDLQTSIRARVAAIAISSSLFGISFCRGNEAPEFVDPVSETSEGTVHLKWTTDVQSVERFELEQAQAASFDPTLRFSTGVETSRYVTGLREGKHFFRVRHITPDGEPGPWSPIMEVSVDYVDAKIVWSLMGAGFLTFAMTVGAIIVGQRRASKLSGVGVR